MTKTVPTARAPAQMGGVSGGGGQLGWRGGEGGRLTYQGIRDEGIRARPLCGERKQQIAVEVVAKPKRVDLHLRRAAGQAVREAIYGVKSARC